MNPRHPGWALLPILGILFGWMFRPSEDARLPNPSTMPVEVRTLSFPDGRALRFLKGPDMNVYLSEIEVPSAWTSEILKDPVSFEGAHQILEWLSDQTGESLRLPTTSEWIQAARAGVSNAEFAWGFGPAQPPEDLHFRRNAPPTRPGPAYGYGFRDLAGGRWEWTSEGILMGSAWSETNPETLRLEYMWVPPPGYGDQDTGLRIVWE